MKNRESEYYGLSVCPYHARIENQYKESKPRIKPITERRKVKLAERATVLSDYFDHHIEKLKRNPESEATGTTIVRPNSTNVCHIFPKRTYPSVMGHMENCVYLTTEEHLVFDRLMDVFDYEGVRKKFPELWEKICIRVKSFLSLVEEDKRLKTDFEIYFTSIPE